jgi:hypothetical protein
MVDEAGNDEEGGTNKLLGATNALLLKLVQQNWTLHQMMITRETSEAIMYMNQAARQLDMDAQSIRLREDAEIYQQQGKGNKPNDQHGLDVRIAFDGRLLQFWCVFP